MKKVLNHYKCPYTSCPLHQLPITTASILLFLGRRLEVREELQVPDHAPARVRHHPAEAVRGRQAAPRLRGHCGQRAREPEGGQAGGLLRQPGEHHVVSPQLQVHLSQRLQCNNNNETIAATAKG